MHWLISNINLVDLEQGTVLSNQDIVVVDGRIRSVQAHKATVNAARALNETSRGLIKPGDVADLVVRDGNPLDDLDALDAVRAVALRGDC